MKRVLVCGMALCVAIFCLHIECVQSRICNSVIRLHIVANSDCAEDQREKLQVRDFVLEKFGASLRAMSKEEATEKINMQLDEIESSIEAITGDPVEVSIQKTAFPTKNYEVFRFPAGEYLALVIRLGAGEGKNWWCVMYPPLCFQSLSCVTNPDILQSVLTPEELRLVTETKGTVVFKFKAVEIWNQMKEITLLHKK